MNLQLENVGIEFKSGIKNNTMELNYISLGRIIRWFKGRVKYETDKIISDDKEFYFIGEYIINNPLNWGSEILEDYLKL